MSQLYGAMDVDEIPDNPFNIDEEGEYTGMIAKSEIRKTNPRDPDEPSVSKWVITYEDTDESSDQFGKNVSEWLTTYPDMTPADLAELEPKEKKQVVRDMSRIKNRLKSLGFEDGGVEDVAELTGTEVEFVVVMSVDKNDETKVYYNVKYVKAL